MKAVFSRAALSKALSAVAGIVPRTSVSPTCTYVKLQCEGVEEGIRLLGTDSEVSMRVKIVPESLEDPSDILLPAERFRMIVSEADGDTVTVETDGTMATVTSGRSRFTLHGLEGNEFPEIQTFSDMEMVSVSVSELAAVIAQTHFAVSREPSRFAINGVHFQIDEKSIELAATDGKRLANAFRKIKGKKGHQAQAIVPPKMISEMRKQCEALGEGEVNIGVDDKHIVMASPEFDLISLLVEGTFPRYRDVIPSDCDKSVIIDRSTLAAKLRQAAVLTSEETRSVTMSFSENTLVMESRTPEIGEAKVELDIDYSGEEVVMAFDTRFFREVLDILKGDSLKLEIKDGSRPGLIREGKE